MQNLVASSFTEEADFDVLAACRSLCPLISDHIFKEVLYDSDKDKLSLTTVVYNLTTDSTMCQHHINSAGRRRVCIPRPRVGYLLLYSNWNLGLTSSKPHDAASARTFIPSAQFPILCGPLDYCLCMSNSSQKESESRCAQLANGYCSHFC